MSEESLWGSMLRMAERELIQKNVRLPRDLNEQLKLHARRTRQTEQEVLEKAVELYLKAYEILARRPPEPPTL